MHANDSTNPGRNEALAPAWPVHASAQASCHIDAPAEHVWRLLCAIDRWPQWNPAVTRARLEGPWAPGSRFVWKSGGIAITSTIGRVSPPHRLVWTGRALGTLALHTWELEALPDGVRVTTAESFGGWLPKLMKASMNRMLAKALPEWLAHLKRAAESR